MVSSLNLVRSHIRVKSSVNFVRHMQHYGVPSWENGYCRCMTQWMERSMAFICVNRVPDTILMHMLFMPFNAILIWMAIEWLAISERGTPFPVYNSSFQLETVCCLTRSWILCAAIITEERHFPLLTSCDVTFFALPQLKTENYLSPQSRCPSPSLKHANWFILRN